MRFSRAPPSRNLLREPFAVRSFSRASRRPRFSLGRKSPIRDWIGAGSGAARWQTSARRAENLGSRCAGVAVKVPQKRAHISHPVSTHACAKALIHLPALFSLTEPVASTAAPVRGNVRPHQPKAPPNPRQRPLRRNRPHLPHRRPPHRLRCRRLSMTGASPCPSRPPPRLRCRLDSSIRSSVRTMR